jgi:hypothetical protein
MRSEYVVSCRLWLVFAANRLEIHRTFAAAADAPALMLVALKPIDKAAFAAD